MVLLVFHSSSEKKKKIRVDIFTFIVFFLLFLEIQMWSYIFPPFLGKYELFMILLFWICGSPFNDGEGLFCIYFDAKNVQLKIKTSLYLENCLLGVVINENCYNTGRVRTHNFTVVIAHHRTYLQWLWKQQQQSLELVLVSANNNLYKNFAGFNMTKILSYKRNANLFVHIFF